MRVVTLIDRLGEGGGAERLAVELLTRLDAGRFECTLCMSRLPAVDRESLEPLLDDLRRADVKLLALQRRSALDLAAWRPLLGLLRRDRVDVLHAHKFGSNLWGALLGRLAAVPVVIAHEHSWPYDGQRLRRFLDRHVISRGSDAIIAVSGEDRRRMIEIERIDPDAIRLIANGIASRTLPSRGEARKRLGLRENAVVVGAVGLLRSAKAYEVLIEAVARLAEEFASLELVVVGEGDQRDALEAQIATLGLADVVKLVGFRPDAPELVAGFDLAVISSRSEGSPLALLEYMQAGIPIVATRVGGIPDMVEDGVEALLVEPGDAQALTEAIRSLLRSPERARQLGSRARERQAAEFDLDVTVRHIEALYGEISSAKRGLKSGRVHRPRRRAARSATARQPQQDRTDREQKP